jgi:hypothetical protein
VILPDVASRLLLICVVTSSLGAAENLTPEVHAFTSFGWLDTSGNDWLGPSKRGSSEFWEAAANATIRPLPGFLLSGQLFARDFQRYDNGRAQLDWLYAEWRPADASVVEVGRVKLPYGLYNEIRDVDAARATVFLPLSVYPSRTRDLLNATDGAKLSGFVHLGPAGALEYAAFAGRTSLSAAGGFATFLADNGLGLPDEIDTGKTWGGMLNWETPVAGLSSRITSFTVTDLDTSATSATGVTVVSDSDPYTLVMASLLYELQDLTLAAESYRGFGKTTVSRQNSAAQPLGAPITIIDRAGAGYLSGTWHFPYDLDLTLACERHWPDLRELSDHDTTRWVVAGRWGITEHWSVKAEYQRIIGPGNALKSDNPAGLESPWGLFAIKTTIDF